MKTIFWFVDYYERGCEERGVPINWALDLCDRRTPGNGGDPRGGRAGVSGPVVGRLEPCP
jgi:hypothetical protein